MIPDLLPTFAGHRCFTDVRRMSEMKNDHAHFSQNLLLWRFARKDFGYQPLAQRVAALSPSKCPQILTSVHESFPALIEPPNRAGPSRLVPHEQLYLTNLGR